MCHRKILLPLSWAVRFATSSVRFSGFAACSLLVLLLSPVATAATSPMSCIASGANPTQLRAEGLTEKTGDVLITCTGGVPADGAPSVVPTANIQIFLNTALTSRLLNAGLNASEALLLVNEPQPSTQKMCAVGNPDCGMYGQGASIADPYNAGTLAHDGSGQAYNAFQGQQTTTGSVTFSSVPIDAPGTQQTLILRVVNLRANANGLGVTSINSPPVAVTATIATSGSATLTIVNNAQQVVGQAQKGLVVSSTPANSFQQCVNEPFAAAGSITFSKGFAASFKIQNVVGPDNGAAPGTPVPQDIPGQIYFFGVGGQAEYAFYNPAYPAGATGAGVADYGTRLRAVFAGIPAGVTLWLPLNVAYDDTGATPVTDVNTGTPIVSGGVHELYAQMVTSEGNLYTAATATGTGAAAGYVALTVGATGTAEAIYEVLAVRGQNLQENLTMPYYISYTAMPGVNSPALGSVTVGGSFAPVSTDTNASAIDTVPRFADTSFATNAFTINACVPPPTSLQVTPSLQFAYTLGGTLPAAQNISIQSTNPSSGVQFTVSPGAGCGWLSLGATSGTTPATVSAVAGPSGLAAGTYNCSLQISSGSASNSPQLVNASLTVIQPATISAFPPSLSFTVLQGATVFPSQTVTISSANSSSGIPFTLSTRGACSWLSVNSVSNTTPATITVFPNPSGLAIGSYSCAIRVNSTSAINAPITVQATLTVAPPTTPSCIASGANPTQLRAEGLTEKTGDVLISCTGGVPTGGAPSVVPTANIQISLNTTLTSRLLNAGLNASEVLLLINEPQPFNQKVCAVGNPDCGMYGPGASSTDPYNSGALAHDGSGQAYNIFQGKQVTTSSVVFTGVPIDAPGTQQTLIFRIVNIRANANALGVAGVNAPPVSVTATISTSGAASLAILDSEQQVIGQVQKGLVVSSAPLTTFQQCTSETFAAAGSITFNKGFATSFKIQNVVGPETGAAPGTPLAQDIPGQIYSFGSIFQAGVEYGFYNPAFPPGVTNAGVADYGTRLRVVFAGIPAGMTIWVPSNVAYDDTGATPVTHVNTGAPVLSSGIPELYAQMVTSEGSLYTAATATGTGTASGYVALTVGPTGTAEAVYEVLAVVGRNPQENLTIPFYISYTAMPGVNSPAPGSVTVAGSFAPVSTDTNASATDSVPRFADTSSAQNAFAINACALTPTSLQVTPSLQFAYTLGGTLPAAQNISIQSTNPSSGVQFTVLPGAGCGWLSLSAANGTTPTTLSALAKPAGLAAGNYNCALQVNSGSVSNSPQVVNTTLTVTQAATISAATSSLSFTYVQGGVLPPAQTVNLTSANPASGVPFTLTASPGCTWLSFSSSGNTTPATITASANAAGLARGNYRCAILVNSTSIINGPETITATLTVTEPTTISAAPSSLSFVYRLGSEPPPPQIVFIASSHPPFGVNFTVTPGPDCGWMHLRAQGGHTPFPLTAWLNTSGLSVGNYTCSITIVAADATNGPQTVQATLSVSNAPTIHFYPSSLTFRSAAGRAPEPQSVFIFAGARVGFSATASQPWISVRIRDTVTPATIGVSVNTKGLAPGTYQGAITFHAPASNPVDQTLPVTLNVTGKPPAGETAGPQVYTFLFAKGTHNPLVRRLTVNGSGAYHAGSDRPWLRVHPTDGTFNATGSSVFSIDADPSGLDAGTYTGTILVSGPQEGPLAGAFVTVTISEKAQNMTPTYTGMAFRVAEAGSTPPQTLYLMGQGPGAANWTVTPTTLSGGHWLTASAGTGTASASSVQVATNATGLAPGDYSGQLLVSEPGAATPQIVGVVLTVDAQPNVSPIVDPIGLLFAGPNPTPQTFSIVNRGTTPVTFESNAYFSGVPPWFTTTPSSGIIAAGQSQSVTVSPSVSGLTMGVVYPGELDLGFGDGSAQRVQLSLVAAPPLTSPAAALGGGGCEPTSLVPIVTSLGGETDASVGRPMTIQVKVVDNCGGIPTAGGSLQAELSNGDPSVPLTALLDGLWAGTITPRTASVGSLVITIQGQIGTQTLAPFTLPLSVGAPSSQPLITPLGVSSAASFAPQQPIAPGTLINISGIQLADQSGQHSGYPLPKQIGGTQVLIAGTPIPLMTVAPDHIVAQVPFETHANTAQQLVVQSGVNQSAPETLPVAPAQPAVFTVNQQGTGQAFVTLGNTTQVADAAHPAKPGETVIVYCSGLGSVRPSLPSGNAAPSRPPSLAITPKVSIGGTAAKVLSAWLAPGSVGLYFVEAVVPEGITPGSEVPIIVTAEGQDSPAVTMAVN